MTDFDETAASAPEFYGSILELFQKAKFDEGVRLARQERTNAQENGSKPNELAALRLIIKGQLFKKDAFNAQKNIDEAMQIAKGDKKVEAALTHLLAQVALSDGSSDPVKATEKAIDAFKKLGDKAGEAAATTTLAKVYLSKGELEKALEKTTASKEMFEKIGEKLGEAFALNTAFDIKVKEDRMYQALLIAEQMLGIYVAASNVPGEAAAQLKAAQAQFDQGDLQNALDRASTAAEMFAELGDIKKKGSAALLMAEAFERVGQLQDAMSTAEAAIALFQEGRDKKGGVLGLKLIAKCYLALKQLGNAATKLEEAAFKYRQIKDKQAEAAVLVELANTQQAMFIKQDEMPARGWQPEDFEQPVRHSRAAIKIYQDSGKTKTVEYGNALVALASSLLFLDKKTFKDAIDESAQKAEEAIGIFQPAGDLGGEAAALKVQAQAIFGKNPDDKDEAIALLEKSRELAEEAAAQNTVKDVSQLIKTYNKYTPGKKKGPQTITYDIDQWRYDEMVMFIRGYEGRAATMAPARASSSVKMGADGKPIIQRQQVLYQLRYQRVQKLDLAAGAA